MEDKIEIDVMTKTVIPYQTIPLIHDLQLAISDDGTAARIEGNVAFDDIDLSIKNGDLLKLAERLTAIHNAINAIPR